MKNFGRISLMKAMLRFHQTFDLSYTRMRCLNQFKSTSFWNLSLFRRTSCFPKTQFLSISIPLLLSSKLKQLTSPDIELLNDDITEDEKEADLIYQMKLAIIDIQGGDLEKAHEKLLTALEMASDKLLEDRHPKAYIYVLDMLANLEMMRQNYSTSEMMFKEVIHRMISIEENGFTEFTKSDAFIEISMKLSGIYGENEERLVEASQGFLFCISVLNLRLKEVYGINSVNDMADEKGLTHLIQKLNERGKSVSTLCNTLALLASSLDGYAHLLDMKARDSEADCVQLWQKSHDTCHIALKLIEKEKTNDSFNLLNDDEKKKRDIEKLCWNQHSMNTLNSVAVIQERLGQLKAASEKFQMVLQTCENQLKEMKLKFIENDEYLKSHIFMNELQESFSSLIVTARFNLLSIHIKSNEKVGVANVCETMRKENSKKNNHQYSVYLSDDQKLYVKKACGSDFTFTH